MYRSDKCVDLYAVRFSGLFLTHLILPGALAASTKEELPEEISRKTEEEEGI